MSLRVLHLNSLLTGGGTDDQCVRLAEGLRRLGVEAEIAGPDGRRFSGIVREAGVPFHATPKEGPLKLGFILAAAKVIRRGGHAVVHGHHGRDLWPTVLAARLSGRRPKVVITRHLAKSPGSTFSKRFLLGRINAMICVSEFVASVLKHGHRDPSSPESERHWRPPMQGDFSRLRVVHGGIDTGRFAPKEGSEVAALRKEWGLRPGDFAFAVIGGFMGPRGKGQREFLKAAALIRDSRPSARFLIIGQGDMERRLRDDIQDLGLEGVASLTGHCSDMPLAMNAIDCLVHPQIGTEALGLVVCEAHACGRPVVASDLDGIPEAFRAAGHGTLVPAENVEALAKAMGQWAGTEPKGFGERVRLHQLVDEEFSLDLMSKRVAGLYGELAGPRP
jgi:glycosyltransferase involved in cell wall biosynthesis